MVRLNMLNTEINKDPNKMHPMNKVEFYELFLYLMNKKRNIKLTTKEIEVLAIIMAGTCERDSFLGTESRYIRDRLSIKGPNYIKIKQSLVEKGVWVNNKLHPSLLALKHYFETHKEVSLMFNVNINVNVK
jgi:hypothetical protein